MITAGGGASWTTTGAGGQFQFDYVRQTECGAVFKVRVQDPASGFFGSATGKVRVVGQTQRLDVVMPGRGSIRGQVRYNDGTVPRNMRVVASNRGALPEVIGGAGALVDPEDPGALARAMDAIDAFGPEMLVVSLGLDTFGGDPIIRSDTVFGSRAATLAMVLSTASSLLACAEGEELGFVLPYSGGKEGGAVGVGLQLGQ